MNQAPLPAVSARDRARVAQIEALGCDPGAVPSLIADLADPSWPVRRAVVAALGRIGDAAIGPLITSLVHDRDDERRIAATVDALVASAGDPDPQLVALDPTNAVVLCDAAQILGRRRTRSGRDALIAWVGHSDDNVAVAAMEALGRLGDGSGIDAIAAAARSGSFFRVFAAIEVLARCEDPAALAPLEALLRDPLAGTEAARALGRRGQADAVPALAALLDARSAGRLRAAATALVAIATRQSARFGASEVVARQVRSALRPDTTPRQIAHALSDGDPEERAALARVLGWLRDPSTAACLVSLLSDELPVARAASEALAELGAGSSDEVVAAIAAGGSEVRAALLPWLAARPDVAPAAIACLDDPDPEVRRIACEVLARATAVDAAPGLFRVLDDPDPRVGQAAAAAIQALGHDRTEALALDAARSPSRRVRRAGLRLIGYFGWPSGMEPLLEAIGSGDARLRETALSSLAFVDDPRALAALLDAAASAVAPDRAAAMRALGHTTGTPAVTSALLAGLSDPDPWVRYYACQSLGRLRVIGHVDVLVTLLEDPASQVRIAVIDALARIPEPAARTALLTAVRSVDPDLRRAALLGVGTARHREALGAILDATRDPDPTTRLIALAALEGFEDADVDPALLQAALDADEAVRSTAIGVLAGRPGVGPTSALVRLLDTPAQDAVSDALTTWVPGRIPAILVALELGVHPQQLVSSLARMARPEVRSALAMALGMEPVATRRAAAAALAAIGPGAARAALEAAAADDPDAEVRRLARHALA